MTDDELFIKSLKNYKNQCVEELSENKRTDGDNAECIEYYKLTIDALDGLLPRLNGIDSLYETENDDPIFTEEEFSFIIECLENYSENFIVDGTNEKSLKETESEYSQLADIMFEFYDDDDEGFDDEDYENEDYDDNEVEEGE